MLSATLPWDVPYRRSSKRWSDWSISHKKPDFFINSNLLYQTFQERPIQQLVTGNEIQDPRADRFRYKGTSRIIKLINSASWWLSWRVVTLFLSRSSIDLYSHWVIQRGIKCISHSSKKIKLSRVLCFFKVNTLKKYLHLSWYCIRWTSDAVKVNLFKVVSVAYIYYARIIIMRHYLLYRFVHVALFCSTPVASECMYTSLFPPF